MPTLFAKVQPLAEAVARISGKTPIGALLKSADWENIPADLRERAFFTATITSAEFLAEAQKGLLEMAQMARRNGGSGALQNETALIADLQAKAKSLGLGPDDPLKAGTLEDITSLKRLTLMVRHNMQSIQEHAKWKAEQDPLVLDAYPAQELVRIEPRDVPRGKRRGADGALYDVPQEGWPARWQAAGGRLIDGRMIALKSDSIWTKISRFGVPWPPFDFESGMGLEDRSREEAEALGLLTPDTQITIPETRLNAELEASVENLSPKFQRALDLIFEDQVQIVDGRAVWRGKESA